MSVESGLVADALQAHPTQEDCDSRPAASLKKAHDEGHVHTFSDFPKMLMEKLDTQRQRSVMCDVTIITKDGHPFRAHKAVLAASSRYLEAELCSLTEEKLDGRSEAVIHLGMISAVGFGILLDLVYTSKLVLSATTVAEVLLAADILDLQQVGAICREYLRSQITSESVACNDLRHDSSSDSLPSDSDVNNNSVRKTYHKKFRRSPNAFERGVSEESTASSSSGISSCSSKESGVGGDVELGASAFTSCRLSIDSSPDVGPLSTKKADGKYEKKSRCASIYELSNLCPADKGVEDSVNRPISAPAVLSCAKPSVTAHYNGDQFIYKRKGCPAEESSLRTKKYKHIRGQVSSHPCDEQNLENVFEFPQNNQSISDEQFGARRSIQTLDSTARNRALTDAAAIHGDLYKVKREVEYNVGASSGARYPTSALENAGNSSESGSAPDFATVATHNHGGSPRDQPGDLSQSCEVEQHGCSTDTLNQQVPVLMPTPAPGAHMFSPVRSISYDGSHGRQQAFVDLNSTEYMKKAESCDKQVQRPYENVFGADSDAIPSLAHSLKTPFPNTSSFLASLYVLSSQGINPASLLNTYGAQRVPSERRPIEAYGSSNSPGGGVLPPPFVRKQLQHSHSVVSSSALLCKLCRLEFTSEWALAMHYRLYHPLNYMYQPRLLSAKEGRPPFDVIAGGQRAEKNSPCSLPPPLTRSTSSPCKFNFTQNEDKEFGAKSLNALAVQNLPVTHKCYHCKKEFSSIFLLRKHKSTEHMKRPFKCHRCDSAFPNKAGLSVHLRSHTGERPYRCKVCNKAFTQLGHVQRHQKVHTGEKPYQCPLCQARVRDKASMHYHILAHQGVKPFKCDQCDARFTKRSSLVKHKNVHTGAFLYQCPQCKASFREKASLSRHVRSQHKDPCFTVSADYVSAVSAKSHDPPKESPCESGATPVDLTLAARVEAVNVA